MKKMITFSILLTCIFFLAGCTLFNTNTEDEFKEEKQIVGLLNSYSVEKTNGFDYALEQKMNSTIVYEHYVAIRLSLSEATGSRVESKKTLNEDIENGQYTELNATSYYKNNKIATYENDAWVWKDCTFGEFASVSINAFRIDVTKVKDMKLSHSGKYTILSFKIDDQDIQEFLGLDSSIKNLVIEIKTSGAIDQLVSFSMSYSQNLTSTNVIFTPYYGSATIAIPE